MLRAAGTWREAMLQIQIANLLSLCPLSLVTPRTEIKSWSWRGMFIKISSFMASGANACALLPGEFICDCDPYSWIPLDFVLMSFVIILELVSYGRCATVSISHFFRMFYGRHRYRCSKRSGRFIYWKLLEGLSTDDYLKCLSSNQVIKKHEAFSLMSLAWSLVRSFCAALGRKRWQCQGPWLVYLLLRSRRISAVDWDDRSEGYSGFIDVQWVVQQLSN